MHSMIHFGNEQINVAINIPIFGNRWLSKPITDFFMRGKAYFCFSQALAVCFEASKFLKHYNTSSVTHVAHSHDGLKQLLFHMIEMANYLFHRHVHTCKS